MSSIHVTRFGAGNRFTPNGEIAGGAKKEGLDPKVIKLDETEAGSAILPSQL